MPFVCRFKVGLHIEVHNENLHWTPLSASTLFLPFHTVRDSPRRCGLETPFKLIQRELSSDYAAPFLLDELNQLAVACGSLRGFPMESFHAFVAFYMVPCLTMGTRSITGASNSKFDTNSTCECGPHTVWGTDWLFQSSCFKAQSFCIIKLFNLEHF